MDFIFAAFNQLQRHSVSRNVSSRVKAKDKHATEFIELINSEGFDEKLKYAAENENSEEAKTLAQQLLKLVRINGSTVPWSPAERAQSISKFYAMVLN